MVFSEVPCAINAMVHECPYSKIRYYGYLKKKTWLYYDTCFIINMYYHGTWYKKKIGYCYGVYLKKYDITVRFRKYGNIMLNGKKTLPYNHGIYSNMYY